MGANKRWRRRPATTDQGREAQLISLAMDLAERQLAEGTASSQVMTHYLKMGSNRETLEQERLRQEVELLRGKVEQLAAGGRIEALYSEALNAMRNYSGQQSAVEDEDEGEEFYDGPDLY